MGEVVGAGLLAHVPTIVLPEATRRDLNNGADSTLVSGLLQLRREVFETLEYDTVVVFDSHWATTVEFVVTAHPRRAGLFTSEELPRGMSRRPYDFLGDPELAHLIAAQADRHGTTICRSSMRRRTSGSSSERGCRTSGGSPSVCVRPRTPKTTSASAGPWVMLSPTATARSCSSPRAR